MGVNKTIQHSGSKSGWAEIGGKRNYFRSSWEITVAAYYEFLKRHKLIQEWEYEPTVFWFNEIKRGVRSYKPDFLITRNDGTTYYVEVKGWMDNKSKTKLKRMAKYYPNVVVEVIDGAKYKEINKMSSLIFNEVKVNIDDDVELCKVEGCKNKKFAKDLCRKHYNKIYKTIKNTKQLKL